MSESTHSQKSQQKLLSAAIKTARRECKRRRGKIDQAEVIETVIGDAVADTLAYIVDAADSEYGAEWKRAARARLGAAVPAAPAESANAATGHAAQIGGDSGRHDRDVQRGGDEQHDPPPVPPAPPTSAGPPADGPDVATRRIALSAITVPPDRLRKLRLEKVDELVESMRLPAGLVQPIVVHPHGDGYMLDAGWHRYAAAHKLEWKTIRAEIREGLDADAAKLVEIDENLIRAELSPVERALHFGERKRLYEKAHPEARHGGDRRSAKSSSQNENLNSFVADAAAKTGKGRSTVARDVTRANNIVVLPEIIGTSLDQGDELDALAKLPEAEQRKLAEQAQAGEDVSAKLHCVRLELQARDDARKAEYERRKGDIPNSLHVGDFRELAPKVIPDNSVQLVFVDPPYDRDAIPLYGAIAAEAKRILVPGGSLITYCGQVILPDVLPLMMAHLRYLWIGGCGCIHCPPHARIHK